MFNEEVQGISWKQNNDLLNFPDYLLQTRFPIVKEVEDHTRVKYGPRLNNDVIDFLS
ncbi:hypothetical protein CLAVI_000972 [Candidatus Clavichlamydia salmonicola]|uniref:hypothetical protein n=1 Tax=Candidatus Clavichlamydia salmonicola TaxID=469812 RepID=UPI001891A21D|nr:hypothetical protein [Candidatus Clavichlamydia salmonicola]MBF5051331.1 hypothetical protein [Candidatus Clavichlamydia salmonicola]